MKSINYLFLVSAFVSQAPALSAMDGSARVESFAEMKTRNAKELADLNAEHEKRQAEYKSRASKIAENRNTLERMREEELENTKLKQKALKGSPEEKTAEFNFHDLQRRKSDLSEKLFSRKDVGIVHNVNFNGRPEENSAELMLSEFNSIDNKEYNDQSSTELGKKQTALADQQNKQLENASKSKLSTVEKSWYRKIMSSFGFGDVGRAADSIKSIVEKNDANKSLSLEDKINIKNALKDLDGKQRADVLDKIIGNVKDESLGSNFPRREKFITFINTILPENEQVVMNRKGTHHEVALAPIKN
ncbi:MAG: hypothetical protein NTU89_00025 [Candidatus Dependentiae bacterium]|nr:hypothetical protein [Candidatus Dependentiae bacterium]